MASEAKGRRFEFCVARPLFLAIAVVATSALVSGCSGGCTRDNAFRSVRSVDFHIYETNGACGGSAPGFTPSATHCPTAAKFVEYMNRCVGGDFEHGYRDARFVRYDPTSDACTFEVSAETCH